jgi:hypothetical protein
MVFSLSSLMQAVYQELKNNTPASIVDSVLNVTTMTNYPVIEIGDLSVDESEYSTKDFSVKKVEIYLYYYSTLSSNTELYDMRQNLEGVKNNLVNNIYNILKCQYYILNIDTLNNDVRKQSIKLTIDIKEE